MKTLEIDFNPKANNFDLLRILAALVVAFGHSYALANKQFDPLSAFLSYGFSGTLAVWSFLIISGFLIARSEEFNSLTSFIASRFLRIYPAFFTIVVFESLVVAPFFYEGSVSEYFQYWFLFHMHNALIWPQNPGIPNVFTNLPFPSLTGFFG